MGVAALASTRSNTHIPLQLLARIVSESMPTIQLLTMLSGVTLVSTSEAYLQWTSSLTFNSPIGNDHIQT